MANNFPTIGIFLITKGEGHKGCIVEAGIRGREEVNVVLAKAEGDITKAKGGCVRRGGSIFTRVQKVEESNGNHVGDDLCTSIGTNTGSMEDPAKDSNGHQFYT